MAKSQEEEFIDRFLNLLQTVEGRRALFENLRKQWTKVRSHIEQRKYQDAIDDLKTMRLFVSAIEVWCSAQMKGG